MPKIELTDKEIKAVTQCLALSMRSALDRITKTLRDTGEYRDLNSLFLKFSQVKDKESGE